MGYSKERTDLWGNRYIQHFDDCGSPAGTSRVESPLFGEDYVQHYDRYGNKTGTSRIESPLFGEKYVQHYDKHGNKTGISRTESPLFGEDYVQHYSEDREETGTSREEKPLFGEKRIQHYGKDGRKSDLRVSRGGAALLRPSGGAEAALSSSGGRPAADFPVGGGAASGGGGLVAVLAVIAVLLVEVIQAWQGFISRNETVLKMALEYAVPVLTMLVIAVRCAAADRKLLGVGILEGAVTAALMSVTMRFGLELSGPVGDLAYSQIQTLAQDSGFYLILGFVFPFFMFALIFLPFPVAGLFYRVICARLEPGLKRKMQDANAVRIRVVCWVTASLFLLLFLSIEMEEVKVGMFIANFLFNGLLAGAACAVMSGLAVRVSGAEAA